MNTNNPCYRASILPLMQTIFATLADLDLAHERELQRIEASSADAVLKARLQRDLEARHRERRTPYAQQLSAIEARIKAGMPDVEPRPDRDAA
jgi:hypothetical protein